MHIMSACSFMGLLFDSYINKEDKVNELLIHYLFYENSIILSFYSSLIFQNDSLIGSRSHSPVKKANDTGNLNDSKTVSSNLTVLT